MELRSCFTLYFFHVLWSCLSYMIMVDTFKREPHCAGYGVAMGCYGPCIVPEGAAMASLKWYGIYFFQGIPVDMSETSSNAPATRIHVNHGLSIDQWFVGFRNDLLHILLKSSHMYSWMHWIIEYFMVTRYGYAVSHDHNNSYHISVHIDYPKSYYPYNNIHMYIWYFIVNVNIWTGI